MHVLFQWSCYVNEFACICMYYLLLLFICVSIYYEFLVLLGIFALFTFIVFACPLGIFTQSMLHGDVISGKSYFYLSHVHPMPYGSVTYLSWPDSCLILCRVGLLFIVMLAGILLVVIQYSLSLHVICLKQASWLYWMGVTWLLASSCHYLMH